MKLKQVNIIMLPSNKEEYAPTDAQFFIDYLTIIGVKKPTLTCQRGMSGMRLENRQHLYFVTNDLIQMDDWFIDDANQVRQAVTSDETYWKMRTNYHKIVATTNEELKLPHIFHLL